MKDIERLLDKYFEGATSAAEEKELRRLFAAGEVPGHLLKYQPLFAYFDEEIKKEEVSVPIVAMPNRRKVLMWVSGVAAAILVLLGIGQFYFFSGQAFCSGDYVVINGRCYTDKQTIREHAFSALQEVSTRDSELFPKMMDDDELDKEIIEKQFRELGNFFSDDE